jgi:NAD(P)-dependent dehydrogenase (short-subunit alcohol dehydrogenase family)
MAIRKKVAVVTGGNRGIGLEICRQLADNGFHVLLTARNAAKGGAAARSLQRAGLDVGFHKLDVTDTASIGRLASYIRKKYGRVDVLVNNAGIYLDGGGWDARGGSISESALSESVEKVRTTMETNLLGPYQLCQALLPMMAKRRDGRVVNVSSGSGQLTDMGGHEAAYRMSKTALNAMTRIFAAEVKGKGVLVNAFCPGWVKTDMGGPNAKRSVAQGADTAVWLATLKKGGPTGGFFRDRKPIPW